MLHAQQWEFEGQIGLSVPSGSFSGGDAVSARITDDDFTPPIITGYSKQDNGFAETGILVNVTAGLRLSPRWKPFLQYTFQQNAVRETTLTQDLTSYNQDDYIYKEDPYQFNSLLTGITWYITDGELMIGLIGGVGVSRSRFPEFGYTIRLSGIDLEYRHTGATDPIYGLALAAGFQADYEFGNNLAASLKVQYLSADFDYSISARAVPGGSTTFTYDDTLSLRTINIGAGLVIMVGN